jgi:hypothetical protein
MGLEDEKKASALFDQLAKNGNILLERHQAQFCQQIINSKGEETDVWIRFAVYFAEVYDDQGSLVFYRFLNTLCSDITEKEKACLQSWLNFCVLINNKSEKKILFTHLYSSYVSYCAEFEKPNIEELSFFLFVRNNLPAESINFPFFLQDLPGVIPAYIPHIEKVRTFGTKKNYWRCKTITALSQRLNIVISI